MKRLIVQDLMLKSCVSAMCMKIFWVGMGSHCFPPGWWFPPPLPPYAYNLPALMIKFPKIQLEIR